MAVVLDNLRCGSCPGEREHALPHKKKTRKKGQRTHTNGKCDEVQRMERGISSYVQRGGGQKGAACPVTPTLV